MLDMGFLPDIKRILQHLPAKRQTLFFSATLPAPIVELAAQMLRDPGDHQLERPSAPAVGITQAVYPVAERAQAGRSSLALLRQGDMTRARSSSRAPSTAPTGSPTSSSATASPATRIHGNRSQSQRTQALDGFKAGRFRVLVATDIAARGIDVEALGHVVNFDVPHVPEDYIHRVGRTARAGATGRGVHLRLPGGGGGPARDRAGDRQAPAARTLEGFDYQTKPAERFEIPIGRAHRGDPGAQGRGARAREGEARGHGASSMCAARVGTARATARVPASATEMAAVPQAARGVLGAALPPRQAERDAAVADLRIDDVRSGPPASFRRRPRFTCTTWRRWSAAARTLANDPPNEAGGRRV